jgi:hypothetical protein
MKTGIFLSEGLDIMWSDLPVRQNQQAIAGTKTSLLIRPAC